MENYVAFIVMVAIGFGVLDLLTDRWPTLQKQIFPFVTLLAYFLLVIRYYYGPDIWTYVPHYEKIPTPAFLWVHPEMATFEWGYNMFCSLLHVIGVSYWGMTAVVTTLYFLAILLLLRKLPKRQIFALGVIIMVDCHMIINENRECLAVGFFIFMVLLLQNRKYILAVILGLCTILTHKSGFLPVSLLLISAVLYNYRQNAGIYTLLIALLTVMILLPVQRISTSFIHFIPLPEGYIKSIEHHLLLGRQIQIIGLIYLAILFAINMFLLYGKKTRYTWLTLSALVGLVCVVFLYQYFFLLNRIRSYFAPFVVYYVIMLLSNQQLSRLVPYSGFIKQSLMVLIMVYYSHIVVSQIRDGRQLHAPMARACTIFELRHATQKQIRDRQMQYAYIYWTQDYMKKENNKL